jgi:hypothetical protein
LSVNQAEIWSNAQARPTPMTIERLVSFTTILEVKHQQTRTPNTHR